MVPGGPRGSLGKEQEWDTEKGTAAEPGRKSAASGRSDRVCVSAEPAGAWRRGVETSEWVSQKPGTGQFLKKGSGQPPRHGLRLHTGVSYFRP